MWKCKQDTPLPCPYPNSVVTSPYSKVITWCKTLPFCTSFISTGKKSWRGGWLTLHWEFYENIPLITVWMWFLHEVFHLTSLLLHGFLIKWFTRNLIPPSLKAQLIILVNEFGTTDNFLLGKKSRNTTKSLGEKRGRVAKVCEFFLDSVHIYWKHIFGDYMS